MKYLVVALRSQAWCNNFKEPDLYDDPMNFGPFKSHRIAKQVRAELNKDRLHVLKGGQPVDIGPTFRKVWIEEAPE